MYNVIKLADKYFDDYKIVSSGKELTTQCFFCYPKSTKKKLTINIESGLFHCWKCGKKGTLIQLVSELKRLNKTIDLSNFKNTGPVKHKQIIEDVVEEIPWPEEFYPFTNCAKNRESGKARDYLLKRRITDNLIEMYQIGYCPFGMYAGRVIVPVFYKEKLVSFIARDYTGTSDRKIMTPPGNGGKGIKKYVYRIEEAAKLDHLIITEGVFSCISVGPRGVALFGKIPTPGQYAQIIAAKPQRVTVALDPDAANEANALARTLLLYVDDVRMAKFPEGEDPNSLEPEVLDKCLREAGKISGYDVLEGIEI